jgi:hypothetical protein
MIGNFWALSGDKFEEGKRNVEKSILVFRIYNQNGKVKTFQ